MVSPLHNRAVAGRRTECLGAVQTEGGCDLMIGFV